MGYGVTIYIERGEDEIKLTVTGSVSRYVPARTSGPPERCHDAEGGECEIESALGPDGRDWLDDLTERERDSAEEKLREAAANDDSHLDYEDDQDDGDF